MGISRYNKEGYADPTAHAAVQSMEEQRKVLSIRYPAGHMEIRLDAFFPCTQEKARKLSILAGRYASPEDKKKVLCCLTAKEQKYTAQIRTFSKKAERETSKGGIRYWETRQREAKRLLLRTQKNLEIFRELAGDSKEA